MRLQRAAACGKLDVPAPERLQAGMATAVMNLTGEQIWKRVWNFADQARRNFHQRLEYKTTLMQTRVGQS